MVGPPRIDKAKEGVTKALDGIGTFARSTSAQLVEQAGGLKDAAVGTAEKLTVKKPDPYEEAIADRSGWWTADPS